MREPFLSLLCLRAKFHSAQFHSAQHQKETFSRAAFASIYISCVVSLGRTTPSVTGDFRRVSSKQCVVFSVKEDSVFNAAHAGQRK